MRHRLPVAMSRQYADRGRALGEPVTLTELDGLGHFELIDPHSTAWPTVLECLGALTS